LTLFNREGLSPLAVAAANGQYDAAAALARAGAPLEWGDKKFHPPLWWAFSVGDLDMARLLLKLGAAPGQMPVGTLQ
jgi:ankyrin repeat protein